MGRNIEISNSDDVIDSRDVIARIEELTEERDAFESESDSGYTPDPEGWAKEYTEEAAELAALEALAGEAEGYGDWAHGESLIRRTYFVEYAEELVKDIGDMPREIPSYIEIDWEATAKNLEADYIEVDFDGVEYLMRA